VAKRNSRISMTPRGEEEGWKEALAAIKSAYALQDTICPLLIEGTYWYNGSF